MNETTTSANQDAQPKPDAKPLSLHRLISTDDSKLLQELANQLQSEWQMGGLADGLYFDWAAEIALRFHKAKSANARTERRGTATLEPPKTL